jgi:hypothetical protein
VYKFIIIQKKNPGGMVALVDKVVGILFHPAETFRRLQDEPIGNAFVDYGTLLVIYAVISSLVSWVGISLIPSLEPFGRGFGFFTAASIPFLVIGTVVLFILGLLIGGAILHLFVYIVGGRKGVEQTLKAVMYGSTPVFVLGWIPILGFLAVLYAIVLEILAVSELHEISTGRAAVAVLLPFLILLILAILALSLFLIVSSTTGPSPVN